MLRDDILKYLEEKTESFIKGNENEDYTANKISEVFKVKRNTVSHYINQMVEEGQVIKINTRPVYFLHRGKFEESFFKVARNIYSSFEELYLEEPLLDSYDIFNNLIGAEGSLKKAIEQIKTSIFYPSDGLPLMLNGPSGVGKSYIADLIHRYSIEMGVISEDAPFIIFNCAQYYNNPELLSSNLFGYVKGAFTGAEKTKIGMLEAADGGILFLDEVHRLNEEGQEKLFTFMDQGVFKRMGESEEWHKAKVRLIFATTESLTDTFLKTFLRRVPIFVTIPGLDERGNKEKLQFIYNFLIGEAKNFNKTLSISKPAIESLLSYKFKGNVGELENAIKYTCASVYSRNVKAEKVVIRLKDMPEKLLHEVIELKSFNINKSSDETIITPNTRLEELFEKEESILQIIKNTYKQIFSLYSDYKRKDETVEFFEKNVFNEIYALIDTLVFEKSYTTENTMLHFTTSSLQDVFRYMEASYNVKFNGDSIYTIAYFLYSKGSEIIEWDKDSEKLKEQLYNYILSNNNEEYQLVSKLIKLISSKMDISLNMEEEIFLSFYLKSLNIEKQNNYPKAVILAHGYATASSITNVVNRMLEKNIFEAFDMPIDISIKEISYKLIEYIKNNDVSKGLIILVDMGSLKDIYSKIEDYINGPVIIINNVSTQMALYVGDMLRREIYLEDIITKLKENNKTEYEIIYPVNFKEKSIVTSCATGIGTAKKIQKLLEQSIPKDLSINIVVQDYERLKTHGTKEAVFQLYDVLAVIGTMNPDIDEINYISLEDLISGRGEDRLIKLFDGIADERIIRNINDNIVRNFSLESVVSFLTILDTNKILEHVEQCLSNLEVFMGKRLPNDKKIALYVHTSCLVERLIRQAPIKDYPDIKEFSKCQKTMIDYIKKSFSVIEEIYNVKINIEEIGYIYDILSAKIESLEEF